MGELKKSTRTSIIQMAQGAFMERVDYEMNKVVDNILDPNTKPDAKRVITVKIELKPDAERSKINVDVNVKSALAPTNPVGTTLCFTGDENGEPVLAEMVPQAPGQLFIDGTEQEDPKILKLYGGQ